MTDVSNEVARAVIHARLTDAYPQDPNEPRSPRVHVMACSHRLQAFPARFRVDGQSGEPVLNDGVYEVGIFSSGCGPVGGTTRRMIAEFLVNQGFEVRSPIS